MCLLNCLFSLVPKIKLIKCMTAVLLYSNLCIWNVAHLIVPVVV